MQSPFQFPSGAQRGAITVGNFDGVHIGHQRIIAQLRDLARQVGGPAVVFTFRPSPVELLRPDQVPLPLTTFAQREQLLRNIGVDEIIFYPTTLGMLQWTAREFFDRIIRTELKGRGMVEGTNFRFGRHRHGDVETLRQFCSEADMQFQGLEPVPLATEDGTPSDPSVLSHGEGKNSADSTNSADIVSSSRIRELLLAGSVTQAAHMLGRPHSITGRVVPGDQRGMLLSRIR
ncbi:MAG: bifunctional riboflavin kinase/FMN adenylyltransferase, partial [Planctomycetota bacterium]|nr:bifunctional riboflavin kinase/FMN adenylyltransferase [Planctomycetota bacterium]